MSTVASACRAPLRAASDSRPCAPRLRSSPMPVRLGDTPRKKTQIIAIYGKGGIGKSFALANLSYMMAQQGSKVL